MDAVIYQGIFDIIANTLPNEWNKVLLYANYSDGSYSIKYYVKNKSGQYTDCYALDGVTREGLIRIFMAIDKVITPERKLLSDKDKWSVMTLIIEHKGTVKAEYDYRDLSDSMFEYEAAWKDKYLV